MFFIASNFGLQDVTPQTWLPTSDCSATASYTRTRRKRPRPEPAPTRRSADGP